MSEKRAIVTVAIGEAEAYARYTRPFLQVYAKRIGVPVLTINTLPPGITNPQLAKLLWIESVFKEYERVLFLDADIIVSPKCTTNIFDIVPAQSVGMCVCPYLSSDVVECQTRLNIVQQFWPELAQDKRMDFVYRMLNSGVMVIPVAHKSAFNMNVQDVQKMCDAGRKAKVHVTDQDVINYRLIEQNVPLYPLGIQWNCMWYQWHYINRFSIHMAHYITSSKRMIEWDVPVWNAL